jgi:N-methylhydantoinase A/oxoprolinase/acetone carboxylase beta subunit
MRIGIDAGGTFTDFVVLHDDGRLETFKFRSEPHAPASVVLAGLERAAAGRSAEVIHGSTVATNALLERKGARTALVTTAGFEDVIQIGRQNRAELYNLAPAPRRPLIGRENCFGVSERTFFDGTVSQRPRQKDLAQLRRRLKAAGIESIAVCFLHAYQSPDNERAVAKMLMGLGYLCCSHEICPEFREYERSSTTLINAYVGPLMEAYLGELERAISQKIWILQSNGGFMSAAEGGRQAVRTVLSGPAGGVIGALATARLSGYDRILGFDMGGTSTDVSLCEGRPRETSEAYIEGFPIRVPMLDIHTVGAGGGSIARVDEGGLLRVGPQSAGADPGPACYGAGREATVTDAHVVLGRIAAAQFLGGEMGIYPDRAAAAVDHVARAMQTDRTAAARGIVSVANANMERAIRAVSLERGRDPRDFALVAFGGCGGLHACEIAEELGIGTVLVPRDAGALSALGMLLADRVRDYAAGALGRGDIERRFEELERRARRELPETTIERLADVRYAGQSYEVTVPWNPRDPAAPFHREHAKLYGYSDSSRAIELVTLRVRATVGVKKPRLGAVARSRSQSRAVRRVHVNGTWREIPVYARAEAPATTEQGPALVLDYGATALVPTGWSFHRDAPGNLIIRVNSLPARRRSPVSPAHRASRAAVSQPPEATKPRPRHPST